MAVEGDTHTMEDIDTEPWASLDRDKGSDFVPSEVESLEMVVGRGRIRDLDSKWIISTFRL